MGPLVVSIGPCRIGGDYFGFVMGAVDSQIVVYGWVIEDDPWQPVRITLGVESIDGGGGYSSSFGFFFFGGSSCSFFAIIIIIIIVITVLVPVFHVEEKIEIFRLFRPIGVLVPQRLQQQLLVAIVVCSKDQHRQGHHLVSKTGNESSLAGHGIGRHRVRSVGVFVVSCFCRQVRILECRLPAQQVFALPSSKFVQIGRVVVGHDAVQRLVFFSWFHSDPDCLVFVRCCCGCCCGCC